MRARLTPFRVLLSGLTFLSFVRGAEAQYQPAKDTLVYVGTYTNAKTTSKGIYVFRLQTQNDEVSQNILLVPLGLAAESVDPAFLALDEKRRLVFAANEIDRFGGQATGSISAFAVDPATGKLNLLNQKPSMGAGPCHLVLDRAGRHVLVANYSGGTVSVLRVEANGQLGEATSVIQHTGKSINSQRQEAPHPHCVTLDPANKFAFVCDLGIDKVMAYRFDGDTGKLSPADQPFAALKPGAGPRHMVFRPDGKFAYVFNELNSTITGFAYDAGTGKLSEVETVPSLPPYFDGANSGAEIQMHPSGKWLFVSNRGHNSVVLFAINREQGTLDYVEEQGTGGKTPRHFGLQPSAKHLAICNQDSNTVLVCRIDPDNGRLKPSGVFADAPSPVCAVFLPPTSEVKR
jgi:6-phosphogluconolactonase